MVTNLILILLFRRQLRLFSRKSILQRVYPRDRDKSGPKADTPYPILQVGVSQWLHCSSAEAGVRGWGLPATSRAAETKAARHVRSPVGQEWRQQVVRLTLHREEGKNCACSVREEQSKSD